MDLFGMFGFMFGTMGFVLAIGLSSAVSKLKNEVEELRKQISG